MSLVELIRQVINDTMKKEGKWSRTSLTMFSSFWIGVLYSSYGIYKYGFDPIVFATYMAVATGLKVIDVIDKHKTNNDSTPNDQI
jgi:hypothetical protein